MAKLSIIFICIALGMVFRRFKIFPDNAPTTLNRFVVWISVPALVLYYIHRIDTSTTPLDYLISAAVMPWLLFFGAWAFIAFISKWQKWDKRTTGAVVLTAGLSNTAFVGFAIIDALYGDEGMKVAVLLDQLGSFLVLTTLGIVLAILYSGQQISAKLLVKKVLSFPPFIAMLLAFSLMPFPMPDVIGKLLLMLSATLVPLAMTSVGMQLRISMDAIKHYKKQLIAGLGYKLILAPAIFYLLYSTFMSTDDIAFRVIILEAAMAPMVTAGIIATEYDLRGELAALLVGLGIVISLISVPFINSFLW